MVEVGCHLVDCRVQFLESIRLVERDSGHVTEQGQHDTRPEIQGDVRHTHCCSYREREGGTAD